MIRRWVPKEVQLPNGRIFEAKFMRTIQDALPKNVTIRRTYRGNPVWIRAPVRAKPAHAVRPPMRGKGFGKIFNFVKKVSKSPLARKIRKATLKELPNVYGKLANKIPNKKLKRILQSDTANYLVDSTAVYEHSKL